jgi:ATP-dependent Clp protease adaptor protein ClpS
MATRTSTAPITETETVTRTIPMYKVLIHNDEVTHFDFVVMVLMKVFNKPVLEAFEITKSVHETDIGLAGVFALEHAELKRDQVHSMARAHKFPLTASIEPA